MGRAATIKALKRLASYVARRQGALERLNSKLPRYNQVIFDHQCGAPACMAGHNVALVGRAEHKRLWSSLMMRKPVNEKSSSRLSQYSLLMELFASYGCNNAESNWRGAVAYVRDVCTRMEADKSVGRRRGYTS